VEESHAEPVRPVRTYEGDQWMTDVHNLSIAGDEASETAPRQRLTRESAIIATYEAALAVASNLDLRSLLQRIADLAREVVPSKYGALGVADSNGRIFEFFTSGISPEVRELLGPIPEGHGLLGELVKHGVPMIVPDIAAHPHSYGFPANHPPMKTLLGVPILHGSRVLGNLYLTEKHGDELYDREDLEIVQMLAVHAASAIDRAQLYGQIENAHRTAIEQRDQMRVIIDQLPSAVLIQLPPDGRVEIANVSAARLLAGENGPLDSMPRHADEFRLLEESGKELRDDARPDLKALKGESSRNRQLLLERADGSRVWVLCQAAPLFDAEGAVTRVVSVFQDVTQLREAEQLKDDFLSLVSHEFRTPLTSIHGGARLLANEGDRIDSATRQELLEDVVTESNRLDRMLANMLSLAAIMAGRLQPSTEPLLLGPFVRKIVRESEARSPGYQFEIDVPAALPPAESDPELLSQVLRNLYENAVKYSPGGGQIVTRATRNNGTLTLKVIDNGGGIAPEHVATVFERFRRPGADPGVRGMGLGLYLSRLLIEVQGGRIWAESDGIGAGASFSVEIPVARDWDDDPGTNERR
jgi:signal transduction histidine kinase